ncbi:MAG: hypothetical protein ACREJU_12760 [Nitrospiraceae bacterium]
METTTDERLQETINPRSLDAPLHPAGIVTDGERWISGLGGSALILYGLGRRTWSGAALAAIGGRVALPWR